MNPKKVMGHPTVIQLGEFTNEMAGSMLTWSHCLEDLGKLLIEDKPLPSDRKVLQVYFIRRLGNSNRT